MVAKIVIGKSIRGILQYNEQKVIGGSALILLASGFATDIGRLDLNQKLSRFNKLNQLNPAVKTNAVHISLNFDPTERLDAEKLQQIAQRYMELIGFGDQPYLAYRHDDASHPHLHIATTLITLDGKRISTHDIGRLVSEPARQQIEKEFGLVKAVGRKQDLEHYIRPVVYGEKPTKQAIGSVVQSVIRDYSFTSLPEFNAVLGQFNIKADRGSENSEMYRNGGLLYTIVDSKGHPVGIPIKASSFRNRPILSKLEKVFAKGMEARKELKQNLRERIDKAKLSKETFKDGLAKEGVAILSHRNEQGTVYGLTFVDHRQKTVFNGSDLGKGYSAKGLADFWSDKVRHGVPPLGLNAEQQLGSKNTSIFNPLEILLANPIIEQTSYLHQRRRKKKRSRGKNQ